MKWNFQFSPNEGNQHLSMLMKKYEVLLCNKLKHMELVMHLFDARLPTRICDLIDFVSNYASVSKVFFFS
jgi:ribosome biogenesis GTPase A